ncbi:hypothetical protein BH10CYA1_BH10CYA1_02380 [soil metagenome]
MQKVIKATLFRTIICAALGAATFGSFRFAQARIQTQAVPLQVMTLPKELGTWKTFDTAFDLTKPDVVAHKYINQDNQWVSVVLRNSQSNAVLHDLTSCLIHADAKANVDGEQHIATKAKTLDATLVNFQHKKGPRRALLWFQKGDQTASNRWAWRLISTTCPSVRDASTYYQVEVTTTSSDNRDSDLSRMKDVAALIFGELLNR